MLYNFPGSFGICVSLAENMSIFVCADSMSVILEKYTDDTSIAYTAMDVTDITSQWRS